MSTAKKLALIAAGYVLAVVGGFAAAAVNEALMPAEILETSPGMVAFGSMILQVLVTGFISLAPTFFVLKLFAEKAPRALLAVVLVVAAIGPASWLAVIHFAGSTSASFAGMPETAKLLLGLSIAFAAIPRMVFGPILLVIEAVTFLLLRGRMTRALLGAAMLMDVVPLSMFAIHMTRRLPY
jgi:hypothetical protein